MSYKSAVLNTPVLARGANGMKAQESSLSKTVDLFYAIGASRGKNILREFELAYHENRDVALRIAQWARDVRGGAGERQIFRDVLKFLEKNYKHELLDTKILLNVAEIGRWDDLLIFEDKEVRDLAYTIYAKALSERNGLAAKWAPRKGLVANSLREFMQLSPKQYRKLLVGLTNVVETQMCAKEFDKINFSHVPSLAMSRYTKAFNRRAPDEFSAYKNALTAGDPSVKINAAAVYPYDVVKTVRTGDSALADLQWKALPDYIGDSSVLPVVDVSGSMTCQAGGCNSKSNTTCLDVAVSLGLYCSDKNTGPFKDLFVTFSSDPKFVTVKGTLSQKLRQMESSNWDMSTNLHKTMDMILDVAVKNGVSQDDMPKTILILSDMNFNECIRFDDSAYQMIQRKYESANYAVPQIVFWNLRHNGTTPVSVGTNGVALVSGFSPAILKSILSNDLSSISPEGIMMKTISDVRYEL